MQKPDIGEILSLLNNENDGLGYIFEVYHALIEFIKSGNAIYDMGHPDFYMGAINYPGYNYSSYLPTLTIFQLAKACSNYLKHFDTRLVWYRDLSTWENFCKFVMEVHQIKYFKRNRRLVISYNYYLLKKECPACGIRRINFFSEKEDEIYLSKKDNLVFINCRRCGKYILTTGTFKYLDDFEKKSKLYVFLATRPKKTKKNELKVSPKILREILARLYMAHNNGFNSDASRGA